MKRTVTFGEIMLRLKTPEHMRILQTDAFEASYGGAEANVAVSLAVLKDPVSFVTKLPENPVGTAALNEVRRYGADTSKDTSCTAVPRRSFRLVSRRFTTRRKRALCSSS